MSVASADGKVLAQLKVGSSGSMAMQTVQLPPGQYSTLKLRALETAALFIEGVAFWNTSSPAVEVYNAAKGGSEASVVGAGSAAGVGMIPGSLALAPDLAIVNFGINDIANGNQTSSQIAANLGLIVAAFRAIDCDVILVIPQPFNRANYATGIAGLRAAVRALSDQRNVPVIDLSASFNDDFTAMKGLMFDDLHPNATFYDLEAARFAKLLL
jgi:lysophospholipase L1-like esterase